MFIPTQHLYRVHIVYECWIPTGCKIKIFRTLAGDHNSIGYFVTQLDDIFPHLPAPPLLVESCMLLLVYLWWILIFFVFLNLSHSLNLFAIVYFKTNLFHYIYVLNLCMYLHIDVLNLCMYFNVLNLCMYLHLILTHQCIKFVYVLTRQCIKFVYVLTLWCIKFVYVLTLNTYTSMY